MDIEDYVEVSKNEDGSNAMELPTENDGTLSLSTMQMYFSNAVSLKYQSSRGNWRGIKFSNGVFFPPRGGWGTNVYIVTSPEDNGKL